jgi:hypothetical protein
MGDVQRPLRVREEENWNPAVTYEPVTGKEREMEIGLDRAFDLLFEAVLKTNWRDFREGKRANPER